MKDERLEKLSELARKGIPIGISEAIEVIEYQASKKEKTAIKNFTKWLTKKLRNANGFLLPWYS